MTKTPPGISGIETALGMANVEAIAGGTGNDAVTPHEAEEEAEGDLADPVALRVAKPTFEIVR